MSPDLMPAFSAGPARLDPAHQRAARPAQPEGLGERGVHVLDRHADPAAHDVAGLDELVLDVDGDVDRDRERQAHVAARLAEDLRVDADDFAARVEQRAAGVARVDGHVGLDEGHDCRWAVRGRSR